MATPTTTTATSITATCNAIEQVYEKQLEELQNHVDGSTVRDIVLKLCVDLGKLGASINALAGAPTGGEKTAALNMQTALNRLARVMAGTDP